MTDAAATSLGAIASQKAERLGFPFILILLYLFMEYARPANPMKFPLVISVILFFSWVTLSRKNWSPQVILFVLLLSVIAVMGPVAKNNYAIFWGFQAMAVQLLCICVPIIHFVNSMRKMSIFINVLIVIYVYVAIFGILHDGTGPGGHIGDENDLSLALNMMIPFAFVSILLSKKMPSKTVFGGTFGLMVSAVIATFSRGGFVGLVPVLLYCFILSPKKKTAIMIGMLLTVGVLTYAPESYWNEMATIVDEVNDPTIGTGGTRREFWRIAMEMFYDNPILGVGYGNFPHNVPEYQLPDQWERLERGMAGYVAHSVYFTVLAELGLAGALIFGALIWYNFKDTQYILREARKWKRNGRSLDVTMQTVTNHGFLDDLDRTMYYAHAIRAGLLGYLVSGLFLSVFGYPHFWILTALTVALKGTLAARIREATESLQ